MIRALVIVLALLTGACLKPARETIGLGAVLPLSGVDARYGECARNGISLAVSEINAAEGVNGKDLRIVYGDSQSTVDAGVPAYQTLITGDRLQATLAMLNPVVVQVAKIANREKGVVLNGGAQDSQLRSIGPYVFNALPDAIEEARVMAEFTFARLNIRDAATMVVDRDSGVAAAAEFRRVFTALGGRIVREEMTELDGEHVRPAVTRLATVGPSAIFIAAPPLTVAKTLREAALIDYHPDWLGNSSFEIDHVMTAAGVAAEGVTYTALRPFSPASPRARQFAADYKARFGYQPEIYAAMFYDGVYALARAIRAAGGSSGDDIARGLRLASSDGAAGPMDFTRSTWIARPLEVRTVKNGRVEVMPER